MKKLLLILLVCIAVSSYAQLNSNATYIKTKFPTEYAQTIRKHSVEKWGTDHEMIAYTINQQSDALFKLVNNFKTENSSIVYDAIMKWSHDGYKSTNMKIYGEIKTLSVQNLIKMHCDWEMVEYEYNNQVNAKNSY